MRTKQQKIDKLQGENLHHIREIQKLQQSLNGSEKKEAVFYMALELLHNSSLRSNFSEKEISEIAKAARLFSKYYGSNYSLPEYREQNIINFLKQKWEKAFGQDIAQCNFKISKYFKG